MVQLHTSRRREHQRFTLAMRATAKAPKPSSVQNLLATCCACFCHMQFTHLHWTGRLQASSGSSASKLHQRSKASPKQSTSAVAKTFRRISHFTSDHEALDCLNFKNLFVAAPLLEDRLDSGDEVWCFFRRCLFPRQRMMGQKPGISS